MSQAALFQDFPEPETSVTGEWKEFVGAGGGVIRYGSEGNLHFPLDFGNGQTAEARRYKKRAGGSDQFRVVHPLCGEVFSRFTNKVAFLAAVAAAIQYRAESRRAAEADRLAAIARQREREAGERLANATLGARSAEAGLADDEAAPTKARAAKVEKIVGIERARKPVKRLKVAATQAENATPGAKRYFNPFLMVWKTTKDFCPLPRWIQSSPLTKSAQIIYANLLFPSAGKDGFCKQFVADRGVVIGLNITKLADHLKSDHETTRRAINELANAGCIELHGTQGQKKVVRYLVHPWMTPEWIAACEASRKKQEAMPSASREKQEAEPSTSCEKQEVPSVKRISVNESPLNESPAREAKPRSGAPGPHDGKGIRAKGRGEESDEAKRARGVFAVGSDAYDDSVWKRLCVLLGPEEMKRSGTAWAGRFTFDRDTINKIVSDLERSAVRNPVKVAQAAWNTSEARKRKSQ